MVYLVSYAPAPPSTPAKICLQNKKLSSQQMSKITPKQMEKFFGLHIPMAEIFEFFRFDFRTSANVYPFKRSQVLQ